MPLKPTDYKFRIPIIMYDPYFGPEEEEKFLENRHSDDFKENPNNYLPDYVIGYGAVDIDNIGDWFDSFEKFKPLQSVRDNDFKCTIVEMKNGNEIFVPWKKEKFEEEYNKHIEKISKTEFEEGILNIELNDEMAEELSLVLREYKKQQRKIKKQNQL